MRVVPTPEFTSKTLALSKDALRAVVGTISVLERSTVDVLIANPSIIQFSTEHTTLYALTRDGVRLIFTIEGADGEDDDDAYIVLADVIQLGAQGHEVSKVFGQQSLGQNSRRNPLVNSRINPRVNSALNPRVNSRINPRVNSRINPRVNSRLNPRVNSRISYRVNSRINPRVNSRLNPRVNSAINPKVNSSYGGPYVYDTAGNAQKFGVRADDGILLVFDQTSSFDSIAIDNGQNGYVVFNTNNDWIEHWVDDGQDGFLRFSLDNEWLGFVV